MEERQALDLTLKIFDIKATELCKASGVSVTQISRYRNKTRDMTAANAFSVIRALPPDAKKYFFDLVNQDAQALC